MQNADHRAPYRSLIEQERLQLEILSRGNPDSSKQAQARYDLKRLRRLLRRN